MTFDIYPESNNANLKLEKYQEIELYDDSPLYNSDGVVMRLISGKYYVQNPTPDNSGRIRICISKDHCDTIGYIIGWVNSKDIKNK